MVQIVVRERFTPIVDYINCARMMMMKVGIGVECTRYENDAYGVRMSMISLGVFRFMRLMTDPSSSETTCAELVWLSPFNSTCNSTRLLFLQRKR